MENEEREVRGMAVVWKRLRALAVFLLVLSMLESDGIEQEIMRISIGYCAEGGSRRFDGNGKSALRKSAINKDSDLRK